jgi:hypothetical protein
MEIAAPGCLTHDICTVCEGEIKHAFIAGVYALLQKSFVLSEGRVDRTPVLEQDLKPRKIASAKDAKQEISGVRPVKGDISLLEETGRLGKRIGVPAPVQKLVRYGIAQGANS